MLSLEGRQLGNYDVIRRIRSGGMGAVYEGRQRTAFGRRVAIKVILGNYAEDRDMRRRFAREARTIARLHHPHILPLIEFGDEQGVLYLVMPFIEGGTLTGYLRRHLPDLHEVSTIFLQMLDAVEYAHEEGLIHRDIKSSNVLLEARRSGPPYAYLADFGLVRTIQQAELESSYAGTPIPLDQVPGTPHYMAPEQTWGVVTPATDIYALGVLLYQLLTGELPYNDLDDIEVIKLHLYAPVPNPCASDASIPAELGAVVERAMAKRAEQRFPDVTDFRQAFLAAVAGPGLSVEEEAFSVESEEDFEVHELPPRPAFPPGSARPSQQLRQPAPIEFPEPEPPALRRSRAGMENDRPQSEARRLRPAGGEEIMPPLAPRRPQHAGREEIMPPLAPRRARFGEGEEVLQPGPHRPRTTGEHAEGPAARAPRITEDAGEARPGMRRARVTGDDEAFQARRARVTGERAGSLQADLGRSGDINEEITQPERRRARVSAEKAESVSRPRVSSESISPARPSDGQSSVSNPLEKAARPGAAPHVQDGLPGVVRSAGKLILAPRQRARSGPGGRTFSPRQQVRSGPSLPDRLAAPVPARTYRRGKRSTFALLLGIIVPVVLILLLLLPRVLGLNIFPSGFPVFGAPPVATITLSVKTRSVSDTFLLTASPQAAQANGNTRVIPDRGVHGSSNGNRSVPTTGLKGTPGVRASGSLLFVNSGPEQVNVSNGFTFAASSGVQVRLTHSIIVPSRIGGKNGKVSAPAVAVAPGQTGNIMPGALNSLCCGGLVVVSNPVAFSGGSDASVVHLVTQNDLDGVRNELAPALQQKALQQIDRQLVSNEVRAGTPDYHISVSADHPVGSEATQVDVSVIVNATALVYNPQVASSLARQLLNSEAIQTIGTGYQPRGGLHIAPATVEQQGNDGRLYLSIAASGLWAYNVTPLMEQQWRQAIKGATVPLAQSYLTTRPGITAASIVLPFGMDHLPTDDAQLVFVVR